MNLAVQRLRDKETFISPQIVDVAERFVWLSMWITIAFDLRTGWRSLMRFIRSTLLNEPDTYRYSVKLCKAPAAWSK